MGNKASPVVLIAEDNSSHLELLSYNIQAAGFQVIKASDGQLALELIMEQRPDILLLDWMLPFMSGIEICSYIRASRKLENTPIILVSARADEEDRVKGLESGADDYIVKPFLVSEVIARIKANLRRIRPSAVGQKITFEDIILDSEQHRVYRDGKMIKMGPTEYSLLSTLIEKPGRVWSRDQLLDRIWGRGIHVEVRTVDVHIGRLRKSLCQHGGTDLLRTV
ncbi:MAG: response regulator, partial [Rhodobacteraceae bacterium]|nr:response regulator [Paracoccaceae bacterium]